MKTLKLVSTGIKHTTFLSRGTLKQLKQKDQLWILPLAIFGVLAGGGIIVYMLIMNYRALHMSGIMLGVPELMFFISILAAWVFVFFLGIPVTLSALYFSRDLKMLIPLPIKPYQLSAMKTGLIFFYTVPIFLVLFIPAAAVYLAEARGSFGFWFSGVIIALTGAVVPTMLSILFTSLLMRLVNLTRYKVFMEVLGMFLALGVIILIQVGLSGSFMQAASGEAAAVPARIAEAMKGTLNALPPAAWGAEALLGGKFVLPLLGFLAAAAAIFIPTMLLLNRSLIKEAGRRQDSSRRPKRKGQMIYPSRRKITAMLDREWRILSSNSTFIFEGIGEILIFPILLTVFGIMYKTMPGDLMGSLREQVPFLGLAVFGGLILFTCITTVSSTSLSREGKNFTLSLSLPMTGRENLKAKMIFHIIFFYPSFLLNTLLVYILLKLNPSELFYFIPGGIVLIGATFLGDIFFDLKRPLLTWNHPQQAMKQNMNALAGMGMSILIIGVFAGIGVLLLSAGLSTVLTGLIITGAALLAFLIFYPVLASYADRRYLQELEITG
ncbi:MAG: putative ABC transporter permease subunit [Spirochaetia bacterium]